MIPEALAGGMQAIQQAVNDQGTFGEYVRGVISSKALVQFWVLMLFGFVGVLANYAYKWLRDEIMGSLWAYLARQHPKRTLLSFATFAGYALATVLSPALDGAGWGVVVNLGLTTGFAIDALINKADRQVWTDEQRAEREAKRRAEHQ